jgi:hypothetical protein
MGWRSLAAAVLTVLTVATGFEVLVIVQPGGVARADVCASVGRRVRVGGCTNIAGAVANYAPPPTYYAPLPEDYPPPPPAP